MLPNKSNTFRLSAIIPVVGRGNPPINAVRSILEQADPIGTEVLVIDASVRGNLGDVLSIEFSKGFGSHKFQVIRLPKASSPGTLRNAGAAKAQGTFLSFLEPKDWWNPGFLAWLEPLLSKHDLILSCPE